MSYIPFTLDVNKNLRLQFVLPEEKNKFVLKVIKNGETIELDRKASNEIRISIENDNNLQRKISILQTKNGNTKKIGPIDYNIMKMYFIPFDDLFRYTSGEFSESELHKWLVVYLTLKRKMYSSVNEKFIIMNKLFNKHVSDWINIEDDDNMKLLSELNVFNASYINRNKQLIYPKFQKHYEEHNIISRSKNHITDMLRIMKRLEQGENMKDNSLLFIFKQVCKI